MRKRGSIYRGAALCALLLLAVSARPPQIEPPEDLPRTYRVKGVGLSIRPFADYTYLRFESGVTVSGEGFSLSAGEVELEIATGAMGQVEALKLPEGGVSYEQLGRDPGEMARRMSRELELPQATFNRSAIRRLSAAGGVVVTTPEVRLSTAALISVDGGQSWSTDGRASLSRHAGSGREAENYSLAADNLLYDTEGQRAAAAGNIIASFTRGSNPTVSLNASKAELNLKSGQLKVSGGLQASYGQVSLVCRELEANLKDSTLKANGAREGEAGPQLNDDERGLSLGAGAISVNLGSEEIAASGGVSLRDAQQQLSLAAQSLSGSLKTQRFELSGKVSAEDQKHDVSLSAERIAADIGLHSYEASGSPVVRQGESTFSGERISVHQEDVPGEKDPRTIVEVHGEQEARIDMDMPPTLPDDISGKP